MLGALQEKPHPLEGLSLPLEELVVGREGNYSGFAVLFATDLLK